MKILQRPAALTALLLVVGTSGLAGCYYSREVVKEDKPVPSSVVVAPQSVQHVYSYPEGRYELHGDGTASSPYYWVWVPSGVTSVPLPPPLPPLPARSAR
jgi:hypothetical protein